MCEGVEINKKQRHHTLSFSRNRSKPKRNVALNSVALRLVHAAARASTKGRGWKGPRGGRNPAPEEPDRNSVKSRKTLWNERMSRLQGSNSLTKSRRLSRIICFAKAVEEQGSAMFALEVFGSSIAASETTNKPFFFPFFFIFFLCKVSFGVFVE